MAGAPAVDIATVIRRVVRDLLERFKREWTQEQDQWLQCTVVNVTAATQTTPASVDITIGGRSQPVTGIRYNAAMGTPKINDVVWALYRKNDVMVVFKLA